MLEWIREELSLWRLRKDLADSHSRLEQESRIARARKATRQELHMLASEHYQTDIAFASDSIAAIRTRRLLRAARRLLIPTPPWPAESSEDWDVSTVTYDPILSAAAAHKLRREIAYERELRQKPWLNWFTLVIALFSLIISIAALTDVPLVRIYP